MKRFYGSLFLLLCGLCSAAAEFRIWQDKAGNSDLVVKWPSKLWFLTPELNYYNLDISGDISLEKTDTKIRLWGRAEFVSDDESSYADLDVEI